jgi:hypothetical protein
MTIMPACTLNSLLTPKLNDQSAPFVHPGLLHTEQDFIRMKSKVEASESPWLEGWQMLINNPRSQLTHNPRPTSTVVRGGTGNNVAVLYTDVHAAYQLAVRWKVSDNSAYANKSIAILNAWSSVLQTVTGNADRFLAAGIHGYQFANAAEIMRTYSGWASEDFVRFQSMMLAVFYPLNHDFLVNHNGAYITNYWANWDLCNIASVLAIGVLCDRRDIYDEAMTYLYHGRGNGAIDKAIYYSHDNNLGQWQESGRDQPHTVFGISLMGPICEMAWNQGDDLYSYWNNRFLSGAEYVAKFNLGYDVPYQPYAWGTGQAGSWKSQPDISYDGRGNVRPVWELVYAHYVNRMGIAAPFTTQSVAKVRPEDGAIASSPSSFDQFGFGTLTFVRDPFVGSIKPSSLMAIKRSDKVVLSWWGGINVTSYYVKRSMTAGGPYTTIAASDNFTYTDTGLIPGIYYYIVTGKSQSEDKETAPSNEIQFYAFAKLHTHLKFNETNGVIAKDSTDNGHFGTLRNNAMFADGKNGNAVLLNGINSYVELPRSLVFNFADFTIATWIYLTDNSRNWPRIFDFGGDRGFNMFLTSKGPKGTPRFSITTVYGYNEQLIDGTTVFPINQWVHIAVTLSDRVGTIYVNGVAIGSNSAIDFSPFHLRSTTNNWIGRSNHIADPYLNAKLQDFRIYNGALNVNEIEALVKQ